MSAFNQQVYIFGIAQNNDPSIVIFQPDTLSFKRIPTPPGIKVNNWCSTLINDNEIYLTGGLQSSGKVVSNEAYRIKPSVQEVSEMPQFTQCRYVHQSIYFNSKLYVLGGRHYGSEFESVLSHCEQFEDGQWKTISPMLKRRSNFQVFIYNNKIHAIGGFNGKKNTKSIEFYDDEKNIWKKLKIKIQRGLAGFYLIPKENHSFIIVGGMTQQGPSSACHLINLKDQTHLAVSAFKESRTLPQMMVINGKYILYGGMQKQPNTFEVFQSDHWEPLEGITFQDQQLKELFDTGMKGFSTTNSIIEVGNESFLQQQEGIVEPSEVSFLVGNDEQPFILSINKNMNDLKLLPVPSSLRLQSYMSSCSIDSGLPNCRQLMVCGGIDSRISRISKRAYLVTIIFPELKIKAKQIGKLQYYRYAAACVYKYPYVYVIGGRGYQNDLLSLHSTVERFNVEEEEWEQVAPLNEAKCSLTAQVLNERLYIFGGYIGEGNIEQFVIRNQGQISHKIEYFNEGSQTWVVLSVELPFSLEGLSSIVLNDEELLIIGGKGIEGSRKEVIHYHAKELEQDSNTSGKVIGNMQYPRSLPKPLMLGNGRVLIIGGQFVDNQEASFGEILNPLGDDGLNEEDEDGILEEIESMCNSIGEAYLSMFSLVQ